MRLVVDASVAIAASHSPLGFARFKSHELIAPPLMPVEATSVLHEMAWRKELTPSRAELMRERVLKADIDIRAPTKLHRATWDLADEMGWAKDLRRAVRRPRLSTGMQAGHRRRAPSPRNRTPRPDRPASGHLTNHRLGGCRCLLLLSDTL